MQNVNIFSLLLCYHGIQGIIFLENSQVIYAQKPPSIVALIKGCSEHMQQIYRRKLMPKFDFSKVALQRY